MSAIRSLNKLRESVERTPFVMTRLRHSAAREKTERINARGAADHPFARMTLFGELRYRPRSIIARAALSGKSALVRREEARVLGGSDSAVKLRKPRLPERISRAGLDGKPRRIADVFL